MNERSGIFVRIPLTQPMKPSAFCVAPLYR